MRSLSKVVSSPAEASHTATATPATASAVEVRPNANVEFTVNLRAIPLFAQLTEGEMLQVRNSLKFSFHEKRTTLVHQGAPHAGLMLLLSGQLQVVGLTEDGRAISYGIIPEGGFWGEISLLNEAPYSATVVALSRVLVAVLPQAQALQLFFHAPSVSQFLLRHLARQVQRDAEFKTLLSIHNTSRRIISFLRLIQTEAPNKQQVIENLPTHQDIANLINASRETVTRVLILLTQQGIIQRDANRLIILDPQALHKLASETRA